LFDYPHLGDIAQEYKQGNRFEQMKKLSVYQKFYEVELLLEVTGRKQTKKKLGMHSFAFANTLIPCV
jgi:hypothetical protein